MTYEYVCTACGHAWEAEQSISEKPLTQCPSCHADAAKRQVSGGAGFILKGGGWYSDLYSSSPKKSGDASDGKSTSSESKTESGSKGGETKGGETKSESSGSPSGGDTKTGTKPSGAAA